MTTSIVRNVSVQIINYLTCVKQCSVFPLKNVSFYLMYVANYGEEIVMIFVYSAGVKH